MRRFDASVRMGKQEDGIEFRCSNPSAGNYRNVVQRLIATEWLEGDMITGKARDEIPAS